MSTASRYQAAIEALGGKGSFVHRDGRPMTATEIIAWERSGDNRGPTIRNYHPRLGGNYSGSDGKSYELSEKKSRKEVKGKKEVNADNRKKRIFSISDF